MWYEGNQSFTTISGLLIGNNVSPNSQYIAGETPSGDAAVSNLWGSQIVSYWNGEATFVNDGGLIVGDTSQAEYSGTCTGTAMAYFPNFNGGTSVNLTTAYAPAGVTFDYSLGVNDAGQILVASNYNNLNNPLYSNLYLLTPATTSPEP